MNGWIGVDLDGTLAYYDGWKGVEHIGKPIELMVKRVNEWIEKGINVKIFTARVCDGKETTRKIIEDWCVNNIGKKLEITNVKDYGMIELWDDRSIQVVINTGISIQDYKRSDGE